MTVEVAVRSAKVDEWPTPDDLGEARALPNDIE
jgi:hypothetical protein